MDEYGIKLAVQKLEKIDNPTLLDRYVECIYKDLLLWVAYTYVTQCSKPVVDFCGFVSTIFVKLCTLFKDG